MTTKLKEKKHDWVLFFFYFIFSTKANQLQIIYTITRAGQYIQMIYTVTYNMNIVLWFLNLYTKTYKFYFAFVEKMKKKKIKKYEAITATTMTCTITSFIINAAFACVQLEGWGHS